MKTITAKKFTDQETKAITEALYYRLMSLYLMALESFGDPDIIAKKIEVTESTLIKLGCEHLIKEAQDRQDEALTEMHQYFIAS